MYNNDYDDNNYYYCENPICKETCPISSKAAVCIKGFYEKINDIHSNYCQCPSGWIGNDCDIKDYTSFKYVI